MNKISGRHADLKYLFTLIKNASKDVASIRVRRPIRGYIYIVDRIAANVSKKKMDLGTTYNKAGEIRGEFCFSSRSPPSSTHRILVVSLGS